MVKFLDVARASQVRQGGWDGEAALGGNPPFQKFEAPPRLLPRRPPRLATAPAISGLPCAAFANCIIALLSRSVGVGGAATGAKATTSNKNYDYYLTGSAAEVTPVSEIGEYRFTPGKISLSLMEEYANLVRRQLQPA